MTHHAFNARFIYCTTYWILYRTNGEVDHDDAKNGIAIASIDTA